MTGMTGYAAIAVLGDVVMFLFIALMIACLYWSIREERREKRERQP